MVCLLLLGCLDQHCKFYHGKICLGSGPKRNTRQRPFKPVANVRLSFHPKSFYLTAGNVTPVRSKLDICRALNFQSGTEMKITLNIDDEIVKRVRKIAMDKGTTLTAMVRNYLTSVAGSAAAARKVGAGKLMETFEKVSRDMGPRTWTREDLYDRPRR